MPPGCTTTLAPVAVGDAGRRGWGFVRLVHRAAEARARRVICLVAGIWILNGFDLAFTIIAHGQDVLHEENPLARFLLQDGTTAIVLFKIGMVLAGSYPLLRFRASRVTELAAHLIFVAYAALAFRWSMCVELYSAAAVADLTLADVQHILGR